MITMRSLDPPPRAEHDHGRGAMAVVSAGAQGPVDIAAGTVAVECAP